MPKHAIAAGCALALCSGPALADLTAQDLWTDWQRIYAAMGTTMTADESYGGGTLTLSDIRTVALIEGVESTSSLGSIELVEQDDGTVRIVLPPSMVIATETTVDGDTVAQDVTLETEGWDAVVSEEGDARIYDITADRMAYVFDDPEVPGADAVSGSLDLLGLATTYTNTETDGAFESVQTSTAEAMTLDLSSEGEGETFSLAYALSDLTAGADVSLDLDAIGQDIKSLSDLNLLFALTFAHGGSTTELSADSSDGPFALSGTAGGGSMSVDLTPDGLGYSLSSTDAQLTVQVAAFPVPVSVSMSELSSAFALPMGVSDTPKPFAASLAWRDLEVDDAIWGLFDPTGQLPRDAATLVLDVTGTALMTTDIFSADAAEMAGPPGELKSLDLNALQLTIAGAELLGNGALTFPVPGPIPQPVGTITLSLDGGLALIDKLVALGFLPPEQAAMAKGMAGVVARPVGEDQLESEIVFSEGGGISANGLPLQ